MQITNGKVSFTRNVRPADFESKAATVELSFVINDDENAVEVVERVGGLAQEKALALVGLKPANGANSQGVRPGSAAPVDASPTPGSTPNKEAAAANLNAKDAKKAAAKPPVTPKPEKPAKDPAAIDEPEKTEPAKDPAAVDGDELFTASAEVTDAELMTKVTQKNNVLKDPPKIRKLVADFVPHPKGVRDIAQANRADFLKKLEALT